MKRRWEDIGLVAPPARAQVADPARQEAAQQQLREQCGRTLRAALASEAAGGPGPADRGGGLSTAEAAPGLADEVERALFLRHHSEAGQEYKNAARTLVASLKRNDDLRRRVVSGEVRAAQLVAMDARELATSAQQQEYARLQELETRRVTLNRDEQRVTTEYRCGRCGGNTCDYMDTGRRDIGKCETWGSKDGQGSSRLVHCLSCGNKWDVDDV